MELFFDIVFKIAQGILTIITLLMIFIKPFRSWLLNVQDRKQQEIIKDENRDEALRCSLRNIITQFYYAHHIACTMHQYEFENIDKIYRAYKKMDGNSFVDKLWEEIQAWNIV